MSDDNGKIGLLLTMPRSGTWYNNMFFWFYLQVLMGKTELELHPNGLLHYKFSEKFRSILGFKELLICHNHCPGFDHYSGEYRQLWDELNHYVEGFNIGDRLMKIGETKDYDPVLNRNARIAYVYRNPLDQAVSFFGHIQNHKDARHRYYVDSDGEQHLIKDVRQYILNVGLESYIKQFFTFKVMKQMCPHSLLMIKYETLTANPARSFAAILYHFGHDISNPSNQQKIGLALALSSKDSIKKIEKTLGHSLVGDQTDPNESHVRGGEIGKWKKHLNNDDLQEIQQRLMRFGLSLADFDIEYESAEQAVS
ncbi:MAG: sulfotransferase domain-containing protein [Phycisphaerales bacterium]|nr:MAG: sulfotransferase domain-containing protein [Phycisphaerales bacterium]